jgi:hypothetical protein
MADCLRSSSFSGSCDTCGQHVIGLHMPTRIHGWFCAQCCPVCGEGEQEPATAKATWQK